jgi:hypothetical protein
MLLRQVIRAKVCLLVTIHGQRDVGRQTNGHLNTDV